MEYPELTALKTIFNPEAAAFNPVVTTVSTSPQQRSATAAQFALPSMAPSAEPLAPKAASRLASRRDTQPWPEPRNICPPFPGTGRPLSQTPAVAPLPGLGHTFGGPRITSLPSLPYPMTPEQSPFAGPKQGARAFCSNLGETRIESDPVTQEIDELAADFGLVGLRDNKNLDWLRKESRRNFESLRAPRPCVQQDAQAGELLGQALNRPLTAATLARLLHERESLEEPSQISKNAKEADDGQSQTQATIAQKQIPYESPAAQLLRQHEAFAKEQNVLRMKPIATAQLRDSLSSGSHQQGRSTLTRRSDQGPEPSAADKYPDDANWVNTHSRPAGQYPSAHRGHMRQQSSLNIGNAMSWPTPVEVYSHKSPATPVTQPVKQWNIFAGHCEPSAEDVGAVDDELLALIGELPYPKLETLALFDDVDIAPDTRPLTPGQESGASYGLGHVGGWNPPPVSNGSWENPMPFRARSGAHIASAGNN